MLPSSAKTSQKNSLTVLVADDHPINQKVIQTMLEEMGCHVLWLPMAKRLRLRSDQRP